MPPLLYSYYTLNNVAYQIAHHSPYNTNNTYPHHFTLPHSNTFPLTSHIHIYLFYTGGTTSETSKTSVCAIVKKVEKLSIVPYKS